jgi:hypothetical protein
MAALRPCCDLRSRNDWPQPPDRDQVPQLLKTVSTKQIEDFESTSTPDPTKPDQAKKIGVRSFEKSSGTMANNNAAEHYQGIYAQTTLVSLKQALPDSVYSSSSITGVSLNLVWNTIEPGKGVYDWTTLDHEVQRALATGKQLALSVTPNHPDTPQWLIAEGVDANTFKGALHGYIRPQEITIASPWDPIYQSEYANMMNALAQHLKSIPGAYDAVSLVKISGIGGITYELKLPNQFNSNAVWQAAGYTPDKVIQAWKAFAQSTENAFSDKILAIMPGEKHPFPMIDNYGNIVTEKSPTYVDITSKIISIGLQMFGDKFMVEWGGVGSGHLSSVVTAAQQQGAIGGYQTNHFLPSGIGVGAFGSAVAPDEATYQSILEGAITKGGVQYLEVWAGDAARNPHALSEAQALINKYQDSADHTIDSITLKSASTVVVHGSTLTITGATSNSGILVVDDGNVLAHGSFINRGSILADGANSSVDIDNTNPDDNAVNVGQISVQDGGRLHVADALMNKAGAVVSAEQNGSVDLDGQVTNRGTIEAESAGQLSINVGVNNNGGVLLVDDAFMFVKSLTGGGQTTIEHGGSIEFGGATNTDVTFAQGAHGTIILDHSMLFKGDVIGFGAGDGFDFTDINFTGAKLRFIADSADPHSGGVLRVQTATNEVVAKIRMDGDYTTANFTAANDGHGHLLVQHQDLLI